MYEQLKLDNQLCFRLYTASRLITQAYRPLLEPLGITYPQYLVLMVLWEQDHRPVSEIGHRLGLESNTLTPLLKRMEREQLVVREHSIADGRQTLVSLTANGRRLEKQAKDVPACMADCWKGKHIDNTQLGAFISMLDELIATLKK